MIDIIKIWSWRCERYSNLIVSLAIKKCDLIKRDKQKACKKCKYHKRKWFAAHVPRRAL